MPLITCPNDGCRKTFKYRMEKKRHLEGNKCTGTPPPETIERPKVIKTGESYLCLLCKTQITHRNNVKRHVRSCKGYSKDSLFVCVICDKEFQHKSKFERHSKVHTRQHFSCDNCQQIFKREDRFNQHKSICQDLPTMSQIPNTALSTTLSFDFTTPLDFNTNQEPFVPNIESFCDDADVTIVDVFDENPPGELVPSIVIPSNSTFLDEDNITHDDEFVVPEVEENILKRRSQYRQSKS